MRHAMHVLGLTLKHVLLQNLTLSYLYPCKLTHLWIDRTSLNMECPSEGTQFKTYNMVV